jgi:hypothetical protein
MKPNEVRVFEYLRHLGYSDIIYEPVPNSPPDFVVDRRIAVEARVLNQNFESDSGYHGLEVTSIPLRDRLKRLFREIGQSPVAKSWFFFYQFQRPLPDWSILKPQIKDKLVDFLKKSYECDHYSAEVDEVFEFDLRATTAPHAQAIVLGGYADHDAGGWPVSEMIRNINLVVVEKARKIAGVTTPYDEWWLALVDSVGIWLDQDDIDKIRESVTIPAAWSQVLVVNKFNLDSSFSL